ncbi:L,D-transpeptidase family protein [Methylomicrobium lacus]|uniref:L,D-transpeptidase family protein n=1 Tax=Methylomicrobium lacus TaxID=136992 RepID=UPI0035A8E2CA
MKKLKKTSAGRLPTWAALVFLLLAVGLLSGCQFEPTTNFLEFPPPAVTPPPDATNKQRPKLASIATHTFSIAKGRRIVGRLAAIRAQDGDTLPDIARHFGLGYNEITLANPAIRPWTPQAGERVLLPLRFILPDAPRKGIVLNLANMRMFYYPPKQPDVIFTYPLGVGREGWHTPLGQTTIVAKKANPAWAPPESIRREHAAKGDPLPAVVPPGPDNPLGKYALALGFDRYLIHGTNKPYGVGMQVSHDCVRLYPEDIKRLFKKTAVGTPVRIVHQPYMTAWNGDVLYLEANEPLQKWAGQKKRLQKSLLKQLRETAAKKGATVDWKKVERILQRTDGIPTPILAASPDAPELVAQAPEVQHPGHFYGQPVITGLTDSDWAILVADFHNAAMAQQLAAMLTHQGPPIPARKIEKNGSYQVIAGPFKNKKEAELIANRIKMDFEIDARPLPPATASLPQENASAQ